MRLRTVPSFLATTALCLAALAPCAHGLERIDPSERFEGDSLDDPSVRILAGHAPLPLRFALVSGGDAALPWEPLSAPPVLPWMNRTEVPAAAALRLWLPLDVPARGVRFTQAYFQLGGGSATRSGDSAQWRPAAGVVMHLGAAPGMLQQMSLGSVLRLDMGAGSQVALRLKGGRLGVQYRLQFSP